MKELIQKGRYQIRMRPNGGLLINPGRRNEHFVPPKPHLREKYSRQISEIGHMNEGLKSQIAAWGILSCGKRNITEGLRILGLPLPSMKTKAGHFARGKVPLDEITSTIKQFWKEEDVCRFMAGENVKLPRINDFAKQHPRVSHSMHRGYGDFEAVLDSVYPGLYDRIFHVLPDGKNKVRSHKLDAEKIRAELMERFYRGDSISKSGLLHSKNPEDRQLYREVMALFSTNHLFGCRKRSYTRAVAKLTGLRRGDIRLTRLHHFGKMAEKLTHLVLEWAPLAEVDVSEYFFDGKVYSNGGKTTFLYQDRECIADLRIDNQAVEVKSGLTDFCDGAPKEFIDRYAPGGNSWLTGEPFSRSTAVFHQPPVLYEQYRTLLEDEGISVVGYDVFHQWLATIVDCMNFDYSRELSDSNPRLANPEYLTRLHEEISFKPHLLNRPGNNARKEWTISLLESLIIQGAELKNGA